MNEAGGETLRKNAVLFELVRDSRERIAFLAALNFCWFMVLPATVWLLADAKLGPAVAAVMGVVLEVARLLARQKARRKLRIKAMSNAAERALGKDTVTAEVLADSAFWSAHIVEFAASIDLPAIAGASAAVLVTLWIAATRSGPLLVAQVGAVLLCAVALAAVSSRLRRPGAYAIVDNRERTAVWMAAAVRDRGELASSKANAAFLVSVTRAVEAWCSAEDEVERTRTLHRLIIAALAALGLYFVARGHGVDPLIGLPNKTTFSGVALLAASLPAAYALAIHLDSLAIASSELSRLTLNAGRPKLACGTPLQRAPRLFCARALAVYHGEHLALSLADLELSFAQPLGIAGPNGSGKTTLATLIAGLRAPSRGTAHLDSLPAHEVDRNDVAFVPQDPVLIEPLSVLENLQLVAPDLELPRAIELLRSLGLGCALETNAGNLSRGEQRRIAIARAVLKNPKLLVLDEPDAWLDVDGRRALLATLRVAARTASVVIVSHRPDTLLSLDTVVVLAADHRVEAVDTPTRLQLNSGTFREILGEESEPHSCESSTLGSQTR